MSVVPCAIRPQVAAGSSFTTGVTFRLGRVKKRRLSKACRNRLCSFDWRGCSDHGAVGDGVSGCHGDLDLPVRAAGKNSTSCFDPHHCRASPAILDRRFTLEAGLSPSDDFIGDVCHVRASVACVMRNVGREAEDIIANRQIAGEVPDRRGPLALSPAAPWSPNPFQSNERGRFRSPCKRAVNALFTEARHGRAPGA
jgi:hypothetical protein